MTDKNIPGLDQSWSQAEKMLDRHFMKRRIMILFFSFVIPAFIAGAFLLMNHSEKSAENNASVTTVTNPGQAIVPGTGDASKSNPELQSPIVANKSASNDVYTASSPVSHETVPTNHSTNKHLNNSVNENNYPADPGHSSSSVNSNSAAVLSPVDDQENGPVGITESSQNTEVELLLPISSVVEAGTIDLTATEKSFSPVKAPKSSKIGWETTIYGGANYVQKSLSVSNDWNNYLSHRQNEEDPIVAPFIGASVSATLNSFVLSMGLEYSAYGEKTNYYPYSNQLSITDITNWQLFLTSIVDTDTAYVRGNSIMFQTTRIRTDSALITDHDTTEEYKYDQMIAENNGVNHIYYIELPIEVSYVLSKGKFGFGLTGGVSPALQVRETGYYLRSDGRGIESLSEIKTFRKLVMNARMSVDFYYRFADRMKLVLRPQFRANLNSVFEDDYPVNQKYYSTGVLFGVSYMLN